MKTKTSNPLTKQSKPISKATAAAEAEKHRGLADLRRKQAQERLDGIEAQIASQKASAAMELWSAAKHDELADAYFAHAETIVTGKIGS